ncbi:MAG TPA: hypothetical protein DEQ87_17670 [Algoriphagus sp.]|nr:hypothetical protein [Algoriphagus sp.]MAN86332.1 hypothetical protein [Algoriphagus sp.]HAD50997.1 hypothetical protein [Algoriphagus sp.]HAH39000.1 hypothetical protein [Algoriphagus sp.]HAS58274.1 hypothetical protein [Algoriphagus sp.]
MLLPHPSLPLNPAEQASLKRRRSFSGEFKTRNPKGFIPQSICQIIKPFVLLRKGILEKKKYRVVGIFWGKIEKSEGEGRFFLTGV